VLRGENNTKGTGIGMELESKIALITGGSSGIGLATALLFAREGAKVAVLGRRADKLRKAKAEIEGTVGPDVTLAIRCDVTDEKAVAAAFRETLDAFGRVDIVVNNAGFGFSAPFEETSLADLDRVLAVHVVGYFIVAREAVAALRKNAEGGSIVFVCSDSSVKAGKRTVAYSSAKAAELHMARCIAEEFGQHHIRVNSVLPGAVFGRSEMWTPQYRKARAAAYGFDYKNLEHEYEKNAALRVTILPEEVAEAILFFAGGRSNKITGAALGVDGGGVSAYVR
jgi:NAD(P)-dependent dehydrogenase (short-subunit alcohol dehydrogenase family)